MILRHRHLSPIDRQLEAFGESWQSESNKAMDSRDGEDMIAVGNNLFLMLKEREEEWRDRVFRGVAAFSPEDDSDHRERYSRWIEATERSLETFGPSVGSVTGNTQLRDRLAEVKRYLETWQSPRLSAAVGLREMTLTPESAAELDQLISEARGLLPRVPQKRMAVRDASFLQSSRSTMASDE